MSFYAILIHLHSVLRWALLLFLILAIVLSFFKSDEKKFLGVRMMPAALITMIFAHLQLVFGLILYFISPKVIFDASSMGNDVLRFFLVEHILVMLIAIVLITIGYMIAKRRPEVNRKARSVLVYFIISLVLILSRIPWPFMQYGGGWV
jgi:hypothetical protein